MAKFEIEDLVFVQSPMPGVSEGGSGVIRSISIGEEGARYLIEFDEGEKDWYHEKLLGLLQKTDKPTRAPRQTGWSQNPELKEAILDAWFKLSPETFNQAPEALEGFGAAMLGWLKETNPELFKTCYLQGHRLIGVTIRYASPEVEYEK